jgi:hypothetical protein
MSPHIPVRFLRGQRRRSRASSKKVSLTENSPRTPAAPGQQVTPPGRQVPDDCAQVALRWEAIAADGELFAALDADLMLTPAGDQITVIALAGGYRRQPGLAGAGPDRAIARRFAEAAIRTFMARLACALVHPAGAAGPAGRDPPPTA